MTMAPVEGIPTVVAAASVPAPAPAPVSEPAAALSAEAAEQIVKQIKHYLSDANLNHDAFMRKGVEMNDGWITFATFAKFNRLRELMGIPQYKAKTNGRNNNKKAENRDVPESSVALLAQTVKEGISDDSLVEVNEDGSAIRRKNQFVPSDEWFVRTVHVKGLPYGKESAGLIDDLTKFCAESGDVQLLRLRRNPKTKAFKGNFLVEFATPEEAEQFAAKQDLTYQENKLEPSMLQSYHDEKQAADEFIQPELRKPGETYPTFEDYCIAHGRPVPTMDKAGNKKGKDGDSQKPKPQVEAVPGCLVKFAGAEGDLTVKQLKEAFGAAGDVKYIEYTTENTDGIVRFKEPVAASVIESHAEGISIGDVKLTLAAVDEEAEKAFFERAQAALDQSMSKGDNRNNKRSGGPRHGGRQNKRVRR
ncbi:hypothetical protein LPJ57_001968 [Coemansia sp. RSA 486]|nr:hypothetical protein LPJ57_001968 [Coemansia sp. RSA 486]KAJ2234903.1 hypothetical protein IWW45_003021 [Coemansia sp. RSA 485]